MSKRLVIALTAGVWVCALGSAGALAYVLDRPLQPRLADELVARPLEAHPSVDPLMVPVTLGSRVLEIPTITIVARHRAPATPTVAPKDVVEESTPDISQMSCTEWRELQMGSGRVQVCE